MKRLYLLIGLNVLPHMAFAEKDNWKTIQLGDGGPSVLLPPGVVPNSGNGIESPEKGWSKHKYEFSIRVSDNMADEPFYIRINLAGKAFRNTTDATLQDLSEEVLKLDADQITWSRKTDKMFIWVRKDRGLKIIQKVFVNPYDDSNKVVKNLWISYPDKLWAPNARIKAICDSWLARIEGSFQPYTTNSK